MGERETDWSETLQFVGFLTPSPDEDVYRLTVPSDPPLSLAIHERDVVRAETFEDEPELGDTRVWVDPSASISAEHAATVEAVDTALLRNAIASEDVEPTAIEAAAGKPGITLGYVCLVTLTVCDKVPTVRLGCVPSTPRCPSVGACHSDFCRPKTPPGYTLQFC
jgi:hypothetical protein